MEAPDPLTVRFRLTWPEASFLVNRSSPFNWIYKADLLAKTMRWYETNVMGTGPFRFVEHVKGSHWVGKKNPDYIRAFERRLLDEEVHYLNQQLDGVWLAE